MTNPITSKSDRDRIRNRAGGKAVAWKRILQIIIDYDKGLGASACMSEIKKAVGKVGNG